MSVASNVQYRVHAGEIYVVFGVQPHGERTKYVRLGLQFDKTLADEARCTGNENFYHRVRLNRNLNDGQGERAPIP